MQIETLVMQITNKCSLLCPQCYMQKGQLDMPLHEALSFILEAKNLGAGAVQITGGEPTAYPFIFEVIEFCSKNKLFTMISTSGHNLDIPKIQRFKDAGLTALCISLNGATEATNQLSRDKHNVAVEAIKQAEAGNGLIVRIHDHTGSKRKILLSPTFKFAGWCETSLMEEPIHDIIESTGDIQLELTPFEVKTILIKL